jgi:spermidine/putrescine-binding protein
VLAYRTDAFKGRPVPETWQDFWDTEKFPGSRGLRKIPFDTIEEALLADGAQLNTVYPCDLNRAFRSLDIQVASDPKRQALLVPYGIGPTQPEVLNPGYIDLKHAKLIPTYPDNIKKGLPSNGLYWKTHQNAVIERFNRWMIS